MNMDTELRSGRILTKEELENIKYIVRKFSHLIQIDLAQTICEGLEWFAPNGKYKTESSLVFFEKMEAKLVFPEGFVLPLMSVFLENTVDEVKTKQDCELKAF